MCTAIWIYNKSTSNLPSLILIDTITTDPRTGWIQYINAINVISIGNQTIKFEGEELNDLSGVFIDDNIAIANILLNLSMPYSLPIIYAPPAFSTPITLISNQFKSPNINGYLTLSDYIIDGLTTIRQILHVRDILVNGHYLVQGITTLSGLINSFYTN